MAVQFRDSNGEKGTKCISQLTTGVKDSGSEGNLLSIVKHGEVVECTWKTDKQAPSQKDQGGTLEMGPDLPGKKTASTNPSMNRQANNPP